MEELADAPCDGEELAAALFAVWAFAVLLELEDDEDAGGLDAEAVDDDVEPPVPFELVDDAVFDGAFEPLPLEAGWDG